MQAALGHFSSLELFDGRPTLEAAKGIPSGPRQG